MVESSGRRRPERSVPSSLPSLTQSLLAGNSVEFCLQRPGSSDDLVLLWPWLDPDAEENELEAYLMVMVAREASSASKDGRLVPSVRGCKRTGHRHELLGPPASTVRCRTRRHHGTAASNHSITKRSAVAFKSVSKVDVVPPYDAGLPPV